MSDEAATGTTSWAQERERFVLDDASSDEAAPAQDAGLPQLGDLFAQLARTLFVPPPGSSPEGGGTDVVTVLARIVDLGARIVPAADIVSVTLRREDERGYTTPVETDPRATRLDRAQYEHGEGPCLTALERGGLGVAESDDLAGDTTWRRFGPAAAELGAGSLFAVGLFPVGDPPLRGALNFYARERGGFGATDRDSALLLAAHAAVTLAHLHATDTADLARADLRRAQEDLDVAKASRDVIGQAKGILMERQGLTAAEAFDTLRRASRDLNVKLRDVAETLVEHRTRL